MSDLLALRPPVPVIELSGSAYERGCKHGEVLREQIGDFIGSIMQLHEINLTFATSCDELKSHCMRNYQYLQSYSPDLARELEGIACGSAQSLDAIMLLNSFLELEDLRVAKLGKQLLSAGASTSELIASNVGSDGDKNPFGAHGYPVWGCTSFNVMPRASADGHAFVGQTYDMEDYYAKYNAMFRITHEDGHTELVYSLAGILGLNGMNSSGVGVCINKLVATDARLGISYPALIRNALSKRRVGDAFGAIVFARRACGMNYQIASADGVAWCVEVSAGDYDILSLDDPSRNGVIAHSNHYLSSRMRAYETPGWLSHGGSYVREQVASRYLNEMRGKIDAKSLMTLSKDHTNYPRCICAHGYEGESEFVAFATIAAVIYDLNSKTAWITNGNPCQNDFKMIALKP
ncbi:MAG: C45 family peptidase [Coriobacteriales bacterium]|jgi:isopenicillin-N N-acyltransferase-like protein|nr:C45 family peptidase [Coriobacteriales bacterium]